MSTADLARDRVNILLHRGQAIARGTREQGAIQASAIATIGDVATHLPGQIEAARAEDRQRQIADIFKTRGADLDGAIDDVTKIDPKVGLELRQRKNASDKAAYDYKLAQHEGALKNIQFMSGLIGSAKDQASYTQALYTAKAAGLDVSKLDPTYNADFVETLNRSALTARERLDMSKPVPPQRVDTLGGDDGKTPVTKFVTPTPGAEFPKPPPVTAPVRPTAVDTVDAKGNRVTRFVTPTEGSEFPKPPPAEAGAQAADITKLTKGGLDVAALSYRKTGIMPALGMGDRSTRQQIINRAAELTPDDMKRIEAGGVDIASNKASFKADQESLVALQKGTDAITAFENTARKNLNIFLREAGKVVDIGSPLANSIARTLDGKVLGSADVAGYNASRQVAINEIAKVTSNPNLTGQLSDSARHEVEAFNPENATLKQTVRVARILTQDMKNRLDSNTEAIAIIKERIRLNGQPDEPATPQMPPPPAGRRNVVGPNNAVGTVPTGTTLPAGWRFVD